VHLKTRTKEGDSLCCGGGGGTESVQETIINPNSGGGAWHAVRGPIPLLHWRREGNPETKGKGKDWLGQAVENLKGPKNFLTERDETVT